MKRCPQCNRTEAEDTLTFCRVDGTPLVRESGAVGEGAGTLKFDSAPVTGDTETRILPTGKTPSRPIAPTTVLDAPLASGGTQGLTKTKPRKVVLIAAAAIIAVTVAASAYFYLSRVKTGIAKNSIAVLPFQNVGGNPNMEYLSDGISESLINSLSQLPNVRVLARTTMFSFKGKDADPRAVGSQLGVDAVLTGRVVQRGDTLTIQADLVNVSDGSQMWGEQYNRKLTDLVALQGEIARDVSSKLRAKLSGADESKLTKKQTENAEAYQLYLKGRFHALKRRLPETQKAITYFQQAIALDPSYALAYVGLADAYLSILAADMSPTEFLPQAKAAAQKAVEIDDTLAEAHAELGFVIFWHDWDWGASENQLKRALELNPNSADAHLFYAHLLSKTGRHEEGLAEAKRARELDPLNLLINALEGQFLIHAGRTDEALARLQKTLELDPNYYLAHLFASSAYIEKGMYAEAIGEARKAREISGPSNTQPMGFLGYALAKSGKEAEARALLEGVLKSSTERYVSAYNLALIYQGLGERDEALRWLERGYSQRDQRMVFLKVEPKWNNLRSDPRFAELVRRVGLPQ